MERHMEDIGNMLRYISYLSKDFVVLTIILILLNELD